MVTTARGIAATTTTAARDPLDPDADARRCRSARRVSGAAAGGARAQAAVIIRPGLASCRMKPSTGSNRPDQGAISRTRLVSA